MANFSFNKVILGGRLTADPELKTTQAGISVCSFSVAVNRRTKPGEEQKADFFNVTAWRGTGEMVARFYHKGSSICIIGAIQNNTWTDKEGQKHYRTDIISEDVYFVDSRSDQSQASPAAPHWTEVNADEGLPF